MNVVDLIIEYETGELDTKGTLKLFSELIKTGMAWTLQGSYGRAAKGIIEAGLIDKDGNIDYEACEERGIIMEEVE